MPQGPINLVPWGLGNLLGLKGESGVFRYVEENGQFGLDLWDLIATQNCLERLAQTQGLTVAGSTSYANLTVPAGEAWLVRGIGFSATVGAAELLRATVGLVTATGSGIRQLTDEATSSLTDAAGAGVCASFCRTPAFFMAAGDFIAVTIKRITTAGSISTTVAMTIYRFKT